MKSRDDGRGERPAQARVRLGPRLVEEIADRGAERPGQDEGGPEQQHARDIASRNRRRRRPPGAANTSAPPS